MEKSYMSWTYKEFEELFQQAVHLKKEEFLSEELLIETDGKDSTYTNLDQQFKTYMFDLLDGQGINIKKIHELKNRFKMQYWWNGSRQDDLNKVVVLCCCIDQRIKLVDQYNNKFEQREEFTDNKNQWIKFIACTIFYQKLEKSNRYAIQASLDHDTSLNSMDSKVYQALIFFRKKGFKVKFKDGSYSIELINDVFKLIDLKISKIGMNFIFYYFDFIKSYKKDYGLYFFKSHYNDNSSEKIFPLGLLFRLGVKHLCSKEYDNKKTPKEIQDIFDYSLHLAHLLELSHTGHDFSTTFSDKTDILRILRRYSQLDQIYKIDQYNPLHVLFLSKKLKESIENIGIPNNILTKVNIIIEIFDLCMSELKDKDIIVFNKTISYEKLCDKYSEMILNNILNDLSHEGSANKNYDQVFNFSKINYFHKPFVKVNIENVNKYLLLHKTFFAMGFYTTLMTILRDLKKLEDGSKFDIDNHVGLLQEKIITDKLSLLSINVLNTEGKYNLTHKQIKVLGIRENKTLETDIVIEFDDRVVFLESKKKVLTNKAKSGDEIAILKDLCDSLIASQIQANRHKRVLNNFNNIKFNDGVELFKKDREIIKVSIAQFDYGSLHTSNVMNAVLPVMLNAKISSNNPSKTNDIRSINKKLDDFTEEFSDGRSFYSNENRGLMFADCHFFNFFHILYILDKANNTLTLSKEDILKQAFNVSRIFYDSMDIFHEFENALYLAEFGKRNLQEIPTI